MQNTVSTYSSAIKIWLYIGLFMVIVQVLVGGITRLTGSGLSITKWEIVTGTLPPIGEAEWIEEFDLYKDTPQYKKINEGMSMSDFKFIYFWEYIHRLWARVMGFVFLFPFLFFLIKGQLDRKIMWKLLGLVGMASIVASFGWIMVASGLTSRPWVDAYKLTLHLNLALILYSMLLWLCFYVTAPRGDTEQRVKRTALFKALLVVFAGQLLLGGVMSGMKAGLYYPTWPDMNGQFIPSSLLDSSLWTLSSLEQYDVIPFAPALTQFLHRIAAYVIAIIVGLLFWKSKRTEYPSDYKWAIGLMTAAVALQIVLGVLTVVNCVGEIPLLLGVLHQLGAIVALSTIVYMLWKTKA